MIYRTTSPSNCYYLPIVSICVEGCYIYIYIIIFRYLYTNIIYIYIYIIYTYHLSYILLFHIPAISPLYPRYIRAIHPIGNPSFDPRLWGLRADGQPVGLWRQRFSWGKWGHPTRWGPRSIAKLVQITPITMICGTYNYSIHGVYKPSNITGGPHLVGILK